MTRMTFDISMSLGGFVTASNVRPRNLWATATNDSLGLRRRPATLPSPTLGASRPTHPTLGVGSRRRPPPPSRQNTRIGHPTQSL